MKRKDYQKPTMKIVAIQQEASLLAGSNELNSIRSDYGDAIEETWN